MADEYRDRIKKAAASKRQREAEEDSEDAKRAAAKKASYERFFSLVNQVIIPTLSDFEKTLKGEGFPAEIRIKNLLKEDGDPEINYNTVTFVFSTSQAKLEDETHVSIMRNPNEDLIRFDSVFPISRNTDKPHTKHVSPDELDAGLLSEFVATAIEKSFA